jgi:predicted acyltransferase
VGRSLALDAFRGFVMLAVIADGFGLPELAKYPSYAWLARQCVHADWEGATFFDTIMPAFLFIAGAVMPFALARRHHALRHVAVRALRLLVFSQILVAIMGRKFHFQMVNVLSQLAVAYFFTYLILRLRFRTQVAIAALLLAGHGALFHLFPGYDGPFSKTDNIGAVIDRWWLGSSYPGYYTTINFISAIPSTLFGAWTGMLVMSERTRAHKLGMLACGALAAFALALGLSPWVPIVKRLWTPSFALYSTGWVFAMFMASFPLVVLGMNPILVYTINQLLQVWIDRALAVFTHRFEWLGPPAPIVQGVAVLLVIWGLCLGLYRKQVFLKL